LSRLPTKDLTRALTVSKHWQKSILGPVVLRRNLFLEPASKIEYLDWVKGKNGELIFRLVHEPETCSASMVVEPHPGILSQWHGLSPDTSRISFHFESRASLGAVHPSTFLTQPPIESIDASYLHLFPPQQACSELHCIGSITFGALLKELNALRVECGRRETSPLSDMGLTRPGSLEGYTLNGVGLVSVHADAFKTVRELRDS
jgi:hypothetical protein